MMKNWSSFFIVLEILALVAFDPSAFGTATGVPAQNQPVCSPDQFMVTINTMSTCVPLKFKDEIVKAHRISRSGGIFLNISGATERNQTCLKCHIRGMPSVPSY